MNDIVFQSEALASPPSGTAVETVPGKDGSARQIVADGPYVYTPLGYSQLTLSGTAQNLPDIPTGATIAQLSLEGNANARYRDDGTAPTSSVGMPVYSTQAFQYSGNLSAFSIIAQAGSPILNIGYYK
jgi:hypothetical protein